MVRDVDEGDESEDTNSFNAHVVKLILDGDVEGALNLLCRHYGVDSVRIMVGTVKRHRGAAACYVGKNQAIYVSRRENLRNPHVILHEFYHHLRSLGGRHRGTERHADEFARSYVDSFQRSSTSRRA